MKSFFPDPPHQTTELKTGLLMFFIGNEHLYSILWSHWGEVCITKIMRCEELASLVDEFQTVFDLHSTKKSISSAFKKFIYEWGPRLIPDAGILADYHILTIIPHQILHGLPFHAIWIEHNEKYFGTTHGISYCSSSTLLLRCADRNIRRLVMNISSDSDADSNNNLPPWIPPSCITVATDVKNQHNDIYREIAAEFYCYFPESYPTYSTRLFKYLAGQSPLSPICIICHGYVDKEKPAASGLIFDRISHGTDGFDNKRFIIKGVRDSYISLAQDSIFERQIFVDEKCSFFFRDLPFRNTPSEFERFSECEAMTVDELCIDVGTNSSLVALFACHSAEGNEIAGDDYTSFAYQWLRVGVASVLANCWVVDVGFIKEFSSRFMDYWIKNRRPKAISFRMALNYYIKSHPEDEPYKLAVISLLLDWL